MDNSNYFLWIFTFVFFLWIIAFWVYLIVVAYRKVDEDTSEEEEVVNKVEDPVVITHSPNKFTTLSITLFCLSLLFPVFSLDILSRIRLQEMIGIGALVFWWFIWIVNGIPYLSRIANITYFITTVFLEKPEYKKIWSVVTLLIWSLALGLPWTRYESFWWYITIETLWRGFILWYCSFIALTYWLFSNKSEQVNLD